MKFDELWNRAIGGESDVDIKVLDIDLEGEIPYAPGFYSGGASLEVTEDGKTHKVAVLVDSDGVVNTYMGEHDDYDPRAEELGKHFSPIAIKAILDKADKIFTKEFSDKLKHIKQAREYNKQVRSHLQDSDDLGFGDLDL
jgi:hypothetical protein